MIVVIPSRDEDIVKKLMSYKFETFKKLFPREEKVWVNFPKEKFDFIDLEAWSPIKLHVVAIRGYRSIKMSCDEYSGFTGADWHNKVMNDIYT